MKTINTDHLKLIKTDFESNNNIYKLSEGLLVKEIPDRIQELYKCVGLNWKDKYKSELTYDTPEISHPLEMITGTFEGYTMKYYRMKPISDIFFDNLDGKKVPFERMVTIYKKVEDIVKKAGEKHIIFPDLRLDNILVNNNNDVVLIDYDGIQVGKYDVITSFSSLLGNYTMYKNKEKYLQEPYNFNQEFNKLSLLAMMSYFFFNTSIVDLIDGETTAEEYMDYICLNDKKLLNKIKNTIDLNVPGEYIADDLIRISEKYDLEYDHHEGCLKRKKMGSFWKTLKKNK